MNTPALPPLPTPSAVAGWHYSVVETVASTNASAASLPAWTAVRAQEQTAGRGRIPARHWVSDRGGLWLSAVVPCPEPRTQWETLPLAAGWAVVKTVRERGVSGARLRWPNDVMVDGAKLAGVLVERHTADTAVVGIGLNLFNRPASVDPSLEGEWTSLARYVRGQYSIDAIALEVLRALRTAHGLLAAGQFASIADELNDAWGALRHVEVTFRRGDPPRIGVFHGVDHHGRLRLTTADHGLCSYGAAQVELFRELPG